MIAHQVDNLAKVVDALVNRLDPDALPTMGDLSGAALTARSVHIQRLLKVHLLLEQEPQITAAQDALVAAFNTVPEDEKTDALEYAVDALINYNLFAFRSFLQANRHYFPIANYV